MVHFEHHTYSGFEPLRAFDVVYGGHFEHRLLSPKWAAMLHQRLIIGEIRIETGCYNIPVVAQGAMPTGAVCIGMVADGIEVTRYNTEPATNDAFQIYAPGTELMYHAAAASRWINFVAPGDLLREVGMRRHGKVPSLPEHGIVSIPVPSDRRACLQQLVDDAFSLAMAMRPDGISEKLGKEMSCALVSAYVDAMFADVSQRERMTAGGRNYNVILACERIVLGSWMLDMDLAALARQTGFSLRSLERIFHEGVGMTPGRWFRNIRLNGALRDLLVPAPDCSVTEVAMRWGFRHLSRFSNEYREAFGELPSQTLRRAQN